MRLMKAWAAVATLGGIVLHASAQRSDLSGTWKLNLAKSKFSPGPAPKSSTVTIKIENGTETYTSEGTNADGKPNNMSFTATMDGKDTPVTGNPFGDTIAIQHPAPNKFTATIKKDGTPALSPMSVGVDDAGHGLGLGVGAVLRCAASRGRRECERHADAGDPARYAIGRKCRCGEAQHQRETQYRSQ